MSLIPQELQYTKEHEWVAATASGNVYRIGITDFAQEALGDIVYIQLPKIGQEVVAGNVCGEIESTKSSMLNSEALKYETPGKKLGFLNKMLKYNLDESFITDQVEVLNNISKAELDALAKAKIHPDKMTIVIVGNSYLIKKKLENLGTGKDGMKFNFKVTEIKK